jgi:hypothetical protein
MFRKLASLLTVRGGETFGFRLTRELDDCGKDIMAVFGVTDFYRDYEDTWEWVEGEGQDGPTRQRVTTTQLEDRRVSDTGSGASFWACHQIERESFCRIAASGFRIVCIRRFGLETS